MVLSRDCERAAYRNIAAGTVSCLLLLSGCGGKKTTSGDPAAAKVVEQETGTTQVHGNKYQKCEVSMPSTVITASYDLLVPIRRRFQLDATSLTGKLNELGLDVKLPAKAKLDRAELDYIPTTIVRGSHRINTGFTLSVPNSWLGRDEDADATIDEQTGTFTVYAHNSPPPKDENEFVLAWYVAVAIADLGNGEVLDPQEGSSTMPVGSRKLKKALKRADKSLNPDESAWDVYPYELFTAIEAGNQGAVGTALEQDGKLLEARDANGYTPILFALQSKQIPIALDLLERGADVCVENRYGKSTIDAAVMAGDSLMVQSLLKRGANPTRVALAMASSGDKAMLETLIDAGCPVDVATPGGWTLLMLATYEGHTDLALWLAKRGASMMLENQDGATALMIAADQNHPTLAKDFLQRGADPTHKSADGSTALSWAKREGFSEVVKLLETSR